MSFPHPIDDRYFEDYIEGDVHDCGSIAVEADEMLAFARRYDPQELSCRRGGGQADAVRRAHRQRWLTAGLMMRLDVEHHLTHVASLASPGLDEMRWLKPVIRATGCRCASAC